mgnify:CR=1 FL=1
MNWNHQYASINGIRVHYVDQGQGMPVILCHGFPHLWFSWHRQITALAAAGYRVIAPDMRGMGQTDAPQDPRYYDIDHITGDLIGLLDHLQLATLRAIVGASYGGMVALAFAARWPRRVERLFVMSAADRTHPMATAWRSVQRRTVRLRSQGGAGR